METTGYIDSVLGSGTKSGYVFTYNGAAYIWECNADPEVVGTTGDRWFFYVNSEGVVRFSSSGPATSTDPPLGGPGSVGGGGGGGGGEEEEEEED